MFASARKAAELIFDRTFLHVVLKAVGLTVYQLPGTNALDVAKRVRARIKELRPTFPAADLMPPAADALTGAARLAHPPARGPLAGLVYDSTRTRRPAVTA